jgi:peroxiredoxin
MSGTGDGSDMSKEIDYDWLAPAAGWHVIHLFYQIDHAQWALLTEDEQLEAKTELARLVQEIRSTDDTQLLTFSMVTPKADVGFLLLTPDLHTANAFEKLLSNALGADILAPSFSYLSLTEAGGDPLGATPTSETAGLYPEMPDWPVFCFYSLSMRRGETYNWYRLDSATRERLQAEQAEAGTEWTPKVRQMVTGSAGLDESEWGVSLFAKDSADIKEMHHRMRFCELAANYIEFGEFYIGIQLPLGELFRRVGL